MTQFGGIYTIVGEKKRSAKNTYFSVLFFGIFGGTHRRLSNSPSENWLNYRNAPRTWRIGKIKLNHSLTHSFVCKVNNVFFFSDKWFPFMSDLYLRFCQKRSYSPNTWLQRLWDRKEKENNYIINSKNSSKTNTRTQLHLQYSKNTIASKPTTIKIFTFVENIFLAFLRSSFLVI